MSILSLLWICGTISSWAATDVFVRPGGNPTKWALVRTPRRMLGEAGKATILQRADGVSSTALGMRRFVFIMWLLRCCPNEYREGFAAEPREHLVHQTQRKRADIEVRAESDANKPFTLMSPLCSKSLTGSGHHVSNFKNQTRSSVAKIWKENLSLGIISFGKVLVIS